MLSGFLFSSDIEQDRWLVEIAAIVVLVACCVLRREE
jgi:hypothetical protein